MPTPTPSPPPPKPALPATVVSMRVRPLGVSHLCFDTDGILGDWNLTLNPNALGLLGATVPAFDFDLFYGILGSMPTLPATGTITFATNPAAGTVVVLNGTTWTFVSSSPTGDQLLIGSTLAATLTAAVSALQASTDTNTKKFVFSASSTVLTLTAATGGTGGNSLTISTTVSGATASGPTLSGGDSSRLLYDFLKIQADVAPFTLATLRAEPRKAALHKAINVRQNTYFAKYANKGAIIARMNQYYFNPPDFNLPAPANPLSKSARLATLSDTNESLWTALNGAYANVNRQGGAAGVVDGTISKLSSDIASFGYEATSGSTDESSVSVTGAPGNLALQDPPAPPDPWKPLTWPPAPPPNIEQLNPPASAGSWFGNWITGFTGGNQDASSRQKSNSYETNSNASLAHEDQSITTSNNVFRHPFYEAKARYERAQISLVDQQFAAFMYAQNVPNLSTVFDNELGSIDADVYRLQIAYLNTILMSPFLGVVTGVYKNPGDAVKAGEPVVRVENYTTILLEARLIFPGLISIGQPATVTTALFGAPSGTSTSISGVVVAARGQTEDDQWHVIIECNNMNNSTPPNPIFPLGYRFDYDDTTVTIG
jgi:biotin carboxyl carrier protein